MVIQTVRKSNLFREFSCAISDVDPCVPRSEKKTEVTSDVSLRKNKKVAVATHAANAPPLALFGLVGPVSTSLVGVCKYL